MPTSNLLIPPSLLRVLDAQRASSSSTSISSASSYTSTGFDRHSKISQFTDTTSLITPTDSIDSIFGNDPQLQPFPRFSDQVDWDGLTDEEWELHSLVSIAECTIKGAEKGPLKDLDEAFLREDIWYDHDIYSPDDEFDAVAAVRARLLKGEQTLMTQRALKIIDKRSGFAPTLTVDKNPETLCVSELSEIEDYAEDFELGDDEILEIPVTPSNRGTQDPVLGVIEEVDESGEQASLLDEDIFLSPFQYTTNIVVPPTPVIRPADVIWDYPSFSSDTSISTADSVSEMIMSPLALENLAIASPAIFHHSFGNVDPTCGSPIVSISSLLFRNRRPLPTSLLDGNLDIAAILQLEIAASLRNANGDGIPRVTIDSPQELGLGLVNGPTSMIQGAGTTRTDSSPCVPVIGEAPEHEFRDDMTTGIVESTSEPSSLFVEVGSPVNSRDSGPVCDDICDEFVLPFEPPQSAWDRLLEDLGGLTSSTSSIDLSLAGDNLLCGEKPVMRNGWGKSSTNSHDQIVMRYVPTRLGSTIEYTGLASDIVFVTGTTVTAGSDHPAASASFANPTAIEVGSGPAPKKKGLGLRLPTGLKRRLSRRSSGIPTSEACQDLMNLAPPIVANDHGLHGFQRRMLSPIAEMDSPQPAPCFSTVETRPIPSPSPSPTRHRNFLKRTLNFLF